MGHIFLEKVLTANETAINVEILLKKITNDGDLAAKEELFQIVQHRLEACCAKISPNDRVFRIFEKADLIQEAMLRIWNALKKVQFENAKHFFNLSNQHLHWAIGDIIRRYKTELEKLVPSQFSTGENGLEMYAGVESATPTTLLSWEDIHSAIEKFDACHREVFGLIWYQGMTQEQVADFLGISSKTVRRRLQRIRIALTGKVNFPELSVT